MALHDNIHIGDVFNKLEVITEPYRKENKRWYVRCKCACGNSDDKEYRIDLITSQHIKSCGCFQKENARTQGLKSHYENSYDLSGEFGVGYTRNTNLQDENYFYFDKEDYNLIKPYCWCFDKDGYLMSMTTGKNIKMHRLIMSCPSDKEVDHIKHRKDGSTTNNDNRKSNLRICTHQNNCWNRLSGRNTSGYVGVQQTPEGKYLASIQGKKLGLFSTFEEAVQVRQQAEEKEFGEYSYRSSNQS